MRIVGALAAFVLAGCFRPAYPNCRVRCDVDGECPSGFGCDQGLCRIPGAPSCAWLPTALGTRLVLWLDASQETSVQDGEPMATWTDRSAAGNTAVQLAAEWRPVYRASAVNDLPAATFNGELTHFRVPDTPSLRFGTDAFTVVVVARADPRTTLNTILYHKTQDLPPHTGFQLRYNTDLAFLDQPSRKVGAVIDGDVLVATRDDFVDALPHLFVARRVLDGASATLEIRVDGVTQGTLALDRAVDIDAPGQDGVIGHNGYRPYTYFQAFGGDIPEIVAAKGALTDDELARLEAYLLIKYAVP
jgi:hypothetical protein